MFLEPGDNRSALQQAGYQLAALMVTLVVAIVGGLLTGTKLKPDFQAPIQWRELILNCRKLKIF